MYDSKYGGNMFWQVQTIIKIRVMTFGMCKQYNYLQPNLLKLISRNLLVFSNHQTYFGGTRTNICI